MPCAVKNDILSKIFMFGIQYNYKDSEDWIDNLNDTFIPLLQNNCKFQLLVEEFRLWALQDGFRHKTVPMLW